MPVVTSGIVTVTHPGFPDIPLFPIGVSMMYSPHTQARLDRVTPFVLVPDGAVPLVESGLFIEGLALPDEQPAQCRAVLEHWLAEFPPASPGDRVLVEELAVASIEKERARQARTAILHEKVRTAAYRFDCEQQAEVETAAALLVKAPAQAMARLGRTAAGVRYLIGRWERLEAVFAVEQTWYGQDRDEAMRLQGVRAGKEHLAENETAYLTYLYCLMAQPDPRPLEMELREIGLPELMPKTFQDHAIADWLPPHDRCRELLQERMELELTTLRAREAWLRTHVEEPARAAAIQRARVLEGPDLAVLRNEQIHDRLFHRAYQALRRSHGQRGSAPARLPATITPDEPRAPRAVVLTEAPPKTHGQAHAVFFNYHSSRRAALEEIATGRSALSSAVPAQDGSQVGR
jgi:hypothetical protein